MSVSARNSPIMKTRVSKFLEQVSGPTNHDNSDTASVSECIYIFTVHVYEHVAANIFNGILRGDSELLPT